MARVFWESTKEGKRDQEAGGELDVGESGFAAAAVTSYNEPIQLFWEYSHSQLLSRFAVYRTNPYISLVLFHWGALSSARAFPVLVTRSNARIWTI